MHDSVVNRLERQTTGVRFEPVEREQRDSNRANLRLDEPKLMARMQPVQVGSVALRRALADLCFMTLILPDPA